MTPIRSAQKNARTTNYKKIQKKGAKFECEWHKYYHFSRHAEECMWNVFIVYLIYFTQERSSDYKIWRHIKKGNKKRWSGHCALLCTMPLRCMAGDRAPHTLNFIISESSVQLHAPAIYLLQKESLAPTWQDAWQDPELARTEWRREQIPHQEPNLVSQTSSQ